MPEQKFRAGDIVTLKSGSPKMTVSTSTNETTRCYVYNATLSQVEFKDLPTIILKLDEESILEEYEE